MTTLPFDIAVLELMLLLVVGAEVVVLAPREQATDGVALRGCSSSTARPSCRRP